MDPDILLLAMGQNGLFNRGLTTGLEEGKL